MRTRVAIVASAKPLLINEVANITKPSEGLSGTSGRKRKKLANKDQTQQRRRKFITQKDDDEDDVEKIESNDISQFRVAIHKTPKNIDEVCDNIRGSVGLSGFKFYQV